MDTARQVIRWAVPGTITLFFVVIFVIVSLAINQRYDLISFEENHFLANATDNILPLAAISITLGFLIYQLYYFMYWHFPFPTIKGREILVKRIDRGKRILQFVHEHDWQMRFGRDIRYRDRNPSEDFPYHSLVFRNRPILENWIKITDVDVITGYQENWTLAQSVWFIALTNSKCKDIINMLNQRVNLLGDIYHSLGACQTAVILAFIFYLFAYELGGVLPNPGIIYNPNYRASALVINFIITSAMLIIFKSGRNDSYQSLERLMQDIIYNFYPQNESN